ncbi:hypothetical protein IRZ83_13315 [Flavobacterium sp. JLP]|uniref:hypothetical protein n=1 Tax=unclassified Flavobacterium TaxID=196869 RepID=UPI00188CA70F|nr:MULTISPECIES: hypothetical protein [unclassified Flavobacterium]MBF4494249.1 hypothetical protein [Flavobacterium sp. MR2016-29]MBF4507649.1 hypothetical protein [Flavobacterium sp. JLP]
MKTKFSILGLITVLLYYSCQDKASLVEDSVDSDSVMTSKNIEQQTLKKWFSFNKESDSIITSAELIIKQQEQDMVLQSKDSKKEKRLHEALYHLEELKKRVNYIKEYETRTESFDSSVVNKLDSLKLDYLKEKLKLEAALCEFQEFNIP